MDAALALSTVILVSGEVMPEVGVEPTHPKVHEFESCASANSATPARGSAVYCPGRAKSMAKRRPAQPR